MIILLENAEGIVNFSVCYFSHKAACMLPEMQNAGQNSLKITSYCLKSLNL